MVGPGARLVGSCGHVNKGPATLFDLFGGKRQMKRSRLFLGASIALLSLALTGCPERIKIGDISRDPGRYFDKEVTVGGKVVRSYGAVGAGVYEIDDGTGTIWVATEKYGVPSKDTYVGVTGKVIPGVTWGGRNYGNGMRETRRRTAERR
jgi:hypothetical protein